ncbi:MAG TPA: PASTA domain-containing protein, partial [Bacillota bacterium]
SADDFLADLARYRTRNLDELIAARRSSDHTLVLGPLPEAAGASDAAALDALDHGSGPDAVAEPRRGRRGLARWWSWAAAALVLLGAAYAGLWYLESWLSPEMVRVPPLTGATLEAAQDSLAPYQISLHVVATRYDNEHAANVIIDHDPPAGELVRLGSRIDVIVSRGPQFVEGGVPDVRGLSERAALLELQRADLKVDVAYQHHPLIPEGHVIDQNPGAATRVVTGTTVRLTVSQGPEPASVTLPSFVGRPYEDVRRELQQLGLEIGTIETQFSDYPRQYVRSQSPAPGTVVRPGDKIDLIVSQGNGLTPHETVLQVQVPEGDGVQRVQVRVQDRSERVVHVGEHAAGATFNTTVHWYGEQADVYVYVNGQLYDHVILRLGEEEDDVG